MFQLLCLVYGAIGGLYAAHLDRRDPSSSLSHYVPGMLWPLMLVAWLVERPVQLLLPPPGDDVP